MADCALATPVLALLLGPQRLTISIIRSMIVWSFLPTDEKKVRHD